MSIFAYAFMQRALLVGILLALIIPCIGLIIVTKRLSMIGDALAHASLAGIAGGLLLGINPILGATVTCILASLGIEAIRKRIPRYGEIAIAITMSTGIGLAAVLSGFVKSATNFNSFLFGSIVAISDFELYLTVTMALLVASGFAILYKALFYIALDEHAARLAGVPVGLVNFLFTIMTALTISVAARSVGALIVSSLLVIPVACGMELGKSFSRVLLYAIAFAEFFTISGLFLSYYAGMFLPQYANLKPGGTIVLLGVATLLLLLLSKPYRTRQKRRQKS